MYNRIMYIYNRIYAGYLFFIRNELKHDKKKPILTHTYTDTVLDGSVILSVCSFVIETLSRCPISKLSTYSESS